MTELLALTRRGDLFTAEAFLRNSHGRIFGGCFLGQALQAAMETTPGRTPTVLYGRFLAPGAVDRPVEYVVETLREGRGFSERRVVALQEGQRLFEAAVTLCVAATGPAHQRDWSGTPPDPTVLANLGQLPALYPGLVEPDQARVFGGMGAIEARPQRPLDFFAQAAPASGRFWIRGTEVAPGSPLEPILALLSDHLMASTALLPHGRSAFDGALRNVTLNHAIWFHEQATPDQWFFHETESPWAGCGRGLTVGRLYDPRGRLLASTAQDLLIRPVEAAPS